MTSKVHYINYKIKNMSHNKLYEIFLQDQKYDLSGIIIQIVELRFDIPINSNCNYNLRCKKRFIKNDINQKINTKYQ